MEYTFCWWSWVKDKAGAWSCEKIFQKFSIIGVILLIVSFFHKMPLGILGTIIQFQFGTLLNTIFKSWRKNQCISIGKNIIWFYIYQMPVIWKAMN